MNDNEILCDQDLKPTEKIVLLFLNNLDRATGTAYPSIKTMAKKLGITSATVQHCVNALVKKEFIQRHPRQDSRGVKASNMYTILKKSAIKDKQKEYLSNNIYYV